MQGASTPSEGHVGAPRRERDTWARWDRGEFPGRDTGGIPGQTPGCGFPRRDTGGKGVLGQTSGGGLPARTPRGIPGEWGVPGTGG